MKIRLESSGGIGNIRIAGEFDAGELPTAVSRRVTDLMHRLEGASAPADDPNLADAMQYQLTIIPDSGHPQRHVLSDGISNPEDLAIVRSLFKLLVDRKRKRQ